MKNFLKKLIFAVVVIMTNTLLAQATFAQVTINETNFPDENFRNWLLGQSYGSDGVLTDSEIANITIISVSSQNISDLTGIRFFSKLRELYCYSNKLTALDVSGLADIGRLYCNDNQLTTLNMSGLTSLYDLSCRNNQLTTLDIPALTNLQWLDCHYNRLATLDLSASTNLLGIGCNNNQLITLDVSAATKLQELYCASNQLTALDLTGLNKLKFYDGSKQTPSLTLTGANNNYSLAIELNNPSTLTDGLTYADGTLTSTSNKITSSPFAVETGNPNYPLSGTLRLKYNSGTSISKITHDALQVVGYYNIMGVKLNAAPESGIYIVVYNNRSTEKIMKK